MKSLVTCLIFASASAFAAPSHQVSRTTARVSVHGLSCVIQLNGSATPLAQRTNSVLGAKGSRKLMILKDEAIAFDLDHKIAQANGCEIDRLDKIAHDAIIYFGFAQNVKLELTKDTSESRRNGLGQCIADFTETVDLDFGDGIILSSKESELRSANDCQ
jgi:hypothetical protein